VREDDYVEEVGADAEGADARHDVDEEEVEGVGDVDAVDVD